MSGKIKKHGNSHAQHLAAQAEFRRRFLLCIKAVCAACGAEDAFTLIPTADYKALFCARGLPMQIHPAPGHTIPDYLLHASRRFLQMLLKSSTYLPFEHGTPLPLQEFYIAGFGFHCYVSNATGNYNPPPELVSRLSAYSQSDGGYSSALNELKKNMNFLHVVVNDPQSALYWFEYKGAARFSIQQMFGIEYTLLMHKVVPPQKHVLMDGNVRPVIRLGWSIPNQGIEYLSVTAEQMQLPETPPQKTFDVYFQSHVLQRMHERLDCLYVNLQHHCLMQSFLRPAVHRQSDGTLLVEAIMVGDKIGYFVVDVQGSMLIVRTFLFLTNAGTPEGDKLRSLYGLQRRDTEFLAIDKLSAFLSDDLSITEVLHPLLEIIGYQPCSHFLTQYKEFVLNNEKRQTGKILMQYLGLNTDNDFLTSLEESNKTPMRHGMNLVEELEPAMNSETNE